jgi:predicted DNA-binding helix-hairpin-helix protein
MLRKQARDGGLVRNLERTTGCHEQNHLNDSMHPWHRLKISEISSDHGRFLPRRKPITAGSASHLMVGAYMLSLDEAVVSEAEYRTLETKRWSRVLIST